MGFQISIAKAKAAFASLIARAEKGEEVIVTRHGKPVARIAPLAKAKPFTFGDLEGKGIILADDLSLSQEMIDEIERGIMSDDGLHQVDRGKPLADK